MALRKVFKDYNEAIAKDLDQSFIESKCKDLLTYNEVSVIMEAKSRPEKSYRFLAIMEMKSEDILGRLVDFFEDWYPWLYSYFLSVRDFGGVPIFPSYNVSRGSLVSRVRDELKTIRDGHILVLTGMDGSGKTCLAAEAVRNYGILKLFNEKVFWISVGNEKEDIIELYHELNNMLLEPVTSSNDEIAFRRQLELKFSEEKFAKGLIVLDDVPNAKVITAFTFGIKLLITTKDTSILTKKLLNISRQIKVPGEFEEHEAIKLWANCLSLKSLPFDQKAQKLYLACKGYIMKVSAIGSHLTQSREAALNESYWDELISHVRREKVEGFSLIGSPVLKLEKKEKEFYRFFSIFFEDVNVSVEALATIWGTHTELEAQLIGDGFVMKNLLVRKYDQVIKKYVYGIHDLYLKYLRANQTKEENRELHLHVLRQYKKKCEEDFSKLPNDHYIYRYIGHHLMNAGRDDEFPTLFQNLEFIEAKLRAVGPSDVLNDFAKYQHLIQDSERNYEWLVERIGQNVYTDTDIDIVQVIFQEVPFEHPVFQKAQELAAKRKKEKNTKYIKFLNEVDKRKNITSEMMKMEKEVTAISATNNSDYILLGYKDGEIAVWDIKSKKCLEVFNDQKGAITCIRIHHKGHEWLSISERGSLLIRSFIEGEVPVGIPIDPKTDVLWADFAVKKDMVALVEASGNLCSLAVWNGKGQLLDREESGELVWNNDKPFVAVCAFCLEDQRLVVGLDRTLIVYSLCSLEDRIIGEKKTFSLDSNLIALCVNPYVLHEFGILFQDGLSMQLLGGSLREEADNIDISKNFEEKFTCCAVMSDIYVGTSRSSISVYSWKTGSYRYQLSRRIQPVAMSSWSQDPGTLWILGDDNTIWKWEISKADISLSCSPNFSWVWPQGSDYPLIASMSFVDEESLEPNGKLIKVIKDQSLSLKISHPSSQGVFHLCEDGECVAYLDNFSSVRLMTAASKILVTTLRGTTGQFVRVFKTRGSYLVVATAKNGQFLPLEIFTTAGPLKNQSVFSSSKYEYSSPVYEVFFLKNRIVVVQADKHIHILNQSGECEEVFKLNGSTSPLLCVTSNKQDTVCLLMEDRVSLCHVKNGFLWTEYLNGSSCCSFSTDGSKLALGFNDGKCAYIDVRGGRLKEKNIKTVSQERLVSISMTKAGEICCLTPTRMFMVTNGGSILPARIHQAKNIAVSSHSSLLSTVDSLGLMHVFEIYDGK